jgi:hypothetical protein
VPLQASPDHPYVVQAIGNPLLPVADNELLHLLVPLAFIKEDLVLRGTQEAVEVTLADV